MVSKNVLNILLLGVVPRCLGDQVRLLHGMPNKNPLNEDFKKKVDRVLEHFNVTGVSVAIVNGAETYAEGYGFADLQSKKAVKPDTLFYTGSTTKAFTAGAWSLLVDDGKYSNVQWDTPMSHLIRNDFVLPDEYATSHVTLEDALSHRSGMGYHDRSYGSPNSTLRDSVRSMRYLPMKAPIRTTWHYCNLMYMAVSHALESVTGQRLGDFLRNHIWEPLKMKRTYLYLEDALQERALATGYGHDQIRNTFKEVPYMKTGQLSGAGDVISNVLDYSKWLRSMIYHTGPLSPAGNAAVTEPHMIVNRASVSAPWVTSIAGAVTYGFGWLNVVYRGEVMMEHDGGVPGFGALVIYLPYQQWGVAMMSNTEETGNLAMFILAHNLIDDLLQVPEEERIDWSKMFVVNSPIYCLVGRTNEKEIRCDEKVDDITRELDNALDRLYPLVPSPPLPLALPIEAYEGTYFHPAYQFIEFRISKCTQLNERLQHRSYRRQHECLKSSVVERTIPFIVELLHVSGEHWLASVLDVPTGNIMDKIQAEFTLSAGGSVDELGIEFEDITGEKIWFARH